MRWVNVLSCQVVAKPQSTGTGPGGDFEFFGIMLLAV